MQKIDNFMNGLKSKPSWSTKDLLPKCIALKDAITQELKENDRVDVYRSTKTIAVNNLKRYDILYLPVVGIIHYFLIYKINHDSIVGVILSSKDKVHSIHKIKNDRFFSESYATNTFATIPLEEGYKSFVRVFEDKKEADVIFDKIQKYYYQVFNPRARSFRTTAKKQTQKITAPIDVIVPVQQPTPAEQVQETTINQTTTTDVHQDQVH